MSDSDVAVEDCRSALVKEMSPEWLAIPRHHAARVTVASQGQDQVYLPIMGPDILAKLRSGSYLGSWDEGRTARIFNAYVDTRLVGVADLQMQRDGWALVEPIYVLPECQGHGVGKKLWEACRDAARHDGARGLRVVALQANEKANRFYARTLGLPNVGEEALTIDNRDFKAIRYEIAFDEEPRARARAAMPDPRPDLS